MSGSSKNIMNFSIFLLECKYIYIEAGWFVGGWIPWIPWFLLDCRVKAQKDRRDSTAEAMDLERVECIKQNIAKSIKASFG